MHSLLFAHNCQIWILHFKTLRHFGGHNTFDTILLWTQYYFGHKTTLDTKLWRQYFGGYKGCGGHLQYFGGHNALDTILLWTQYFWHNNTLMDTKLWTQYFGEHIFVCIHPTICVHVCAHIYIVHIYILYTCFHIQNLLDWWLGSPRPVTVIMFFSVYLQFSDVCITLSRIMYKHIWTSACELRISHTGWTGDIGCPRPV